MHRSLLPQLARKTLSNYLHQSGSILYSSFDTLKPGDIYLLGFNPGGEKGESLEERIEQLPHKTCNDYLRGDWSNRNNKNPESNLLPLQRRVSWLLCNLGKNPEEVCASNLIFIRSRSAEGVEYKTLAEDCWKVHEAILELVQPKLIIAFGNGEGNSTYQFLRSKFKPKNIEEWREPSGHGNWKIKGFETTLQGKACHVVGLPHLSRYDPEKMGNVIEMFKEKMQ